MGWPSLGVVDWVADSMHKLHFPIYLCVISVGQSYNVAVLIFLLLCDLVEESRNIHGIKTSYSYGGVGVVLRTY